jgi:hypothetical protein
MFCESLAEGSAACWNASSLWVPSVELGLEWTLGYDLRLPDRALDEENMAPARISEALRYVRLEFHSAGN